MNYGLAYGLSAFGLSDQLRISTEEARGLMDELLRRLRRGARLPAQRRRRRPQGRLHGDHHGPPPLPARPHQRQPAAPRDGRADGAQRADPGQRRRHHQGRHARRAPRARGRGPAQPDAAAGARRAGARGRRGRARARRGAGAPGDGRGGAAVACRWRCRSATGAAGTTRRTDGPSGAGAVRARARPGRACGPVRGRPWRRRRRRGGRCACVPARRPSRRAPRARAGRHGCPPRCPRC